MRGARLCPPALVCGIHVAYCILAWFGPWCPGRSAAQRCAADDVVATGPLLWLLAGVEPLNPIVETSPAAHIAPIVNLLSRRGVSQPKLWVCSHDLKPVAAEAAAIAQPTHMPAG